MKEVFRTILMKLGNRTFILTIVVLFIFGAMWSSLYHIQILNAERYQNIISENVYDEQVIQGIRGEIFDRYGRPLAINTTSLSLYYLPDTDNSNLNTSIKLLLDIFEANQDEISLEQVFPINYDVNIGFYFIDDYDVAVNEIGLYNFLAEIFNSSRDELTFEQKNVTAEEAFQYIIDTTFQLPANENVGTLLQMARIRYAIFCGRWDRTAPVLIAKNVSEKTQAAIMERRNDFNGFIVTKQYTREYPEGELFAHIVGYASHINAVELEEKSNEGYTEEDIIGKTGIELQYEKALRGKDGVMRIELDGETGNRVNEITLFPAEQGNSIFLTIDRDLQKQAYDALYNQIKSLLIKKITGVSSGAASEDGETYSITDIFCALFDNHFIPISIVENSGKSYANTLKEVYDQQSEWHLSQLRSVIIESNTSFRYYPEIQKDIYNLMIESMRDNEHLSYDYQTDEEFYTIYASGNMAPREFFEYCLEQGYLSKAIYNLADEIETEEMISSILSSEFDNLRRNSEYKKRIYRYILENQLYSEESFLYLLYEEELLSNEDGSREEVISGNLTPLSCIIQKIRADEITPADLNLDPCSGSIVLSDCNSGEILAMASYPSFDPNLFLNSSSYYDQIVLDNSGPLTFRALHEMRAIGSTYKMCTAITGLDLNYIDEETVIYDYHSYPNVNSTTQPACWSKVSHGDTTVVTALDHSCNYFFYEVGFLLSDPKENMEFDDQVGLKKMADYAEKLGLATKTGIEIGEGTPKTSDQDAVRSAIGQGTNAFSAANVNRYTCTLANGGYVYDLFIVDAIHSAHGEVLNETVPNLVSDTGISQKIYNTIKEGMRMVVTDEHQEEFKRLETGGMKTAGKTGTAQESEDRSDHSYFTGYAPYDQPDIAVTVVIPYGGGSSNAIPVFTDVVANYYGIALDTRQ